jgi:flagellin
MSQINTNIPSLVARSNLRRANDDLQVRLERLSTGLRINRGADDPAGLIIANRLGSEISGLNQAVRNSERASAVISTAEGALNEAAELLNSIKGLVVEAANTGAISDDERRANQLQIDSAIDSLTRISETTTFGGLQLLNGSLDYRLEGIANSAITRAQVFNANLNNRDSLDVTVETVASAQKARVYLRGDPAGGAPIGRIPSAVTVEIAGPRGVRVLNFLASTPLSAIRDAINQLSDTTGVTARFGGAANSAPLIVESEAYGSSQFVGFRVLGTASPGFRTAAIADNGDFPASTATWAAISAIGVTTNPQNENGRDVFALINGRLGTGDGLKVRLPDTTSLGLEITLNEALAIRPTETSTFSITGGGSLFQLGGEINSNQQINLGLPSIAASRLGGTLIKGKMEFLESIKSGGSNDLRSKNFQNASDLISQAIDEISVIRGRLGALERNTLDTNVRSIQIAIENLTSSQSVIRDADFASETAALTRAQILAQAGTSVTQLANQQAQSVLALLQG